MECRSFSAVTEDITASLVREYLSRKGLTSTLTSLDRELPSTEDSIRNRVQLARSIGAEKLMKKNKESEKPFRSILEVITANLVEKVDKRKKVGDEDQETDMYRKMREGNQPPPEEMVLEDAEDGETVLGAGNVASTRPPSGPGSGQQRTAKHRHNHDTRVTSNLSDREQQKLKRALKQPRYLVNDNNNGIQDSPSSKPIDTGGSKMNSAHECTPAPNHGPVRKTSQESRKNSVDSRKNSVDSRKSSVDSVIERPPSGARRNIDVGKIFQETKTSEPEPQRSEIKNSMPVAQHCPGETKPKSRAELLAMLDMEDPNRIGPNAIKDIEEKPLMEKDARSKLGDLELDDLDESDLAEAELIMPVQPEVSVTSKRNSRPIDFVTAQELKRIIFGTTLQQFYDEWKLQGFAFSNEVDVKYGIVQKKGGPCGVLAAVQACCLQALLFQTEAAPEQKKVRPARSERTEALVSGLSTILWRCGDERSAIVTMPSGQSYFSGSNKFKADGLTETLMLTSFDDLEDLRRFLQANVTQFESTDSPGVILLLYSAILSRGIENVKSDMDDRDGKLMGQHFYCTQDMVNLLLTGRASSNVFNDTIELAGEEDVTVLKGLTKRSDIGFLSLFEHFKSCQVGTYYKTPKYPIWVVCCESHFSVLFSTKKDLVSDWKAERRFDLFYYDGLANQTEEIRLTVDTTSRFYEPPYDEDMVPPLENCIRTKWPEAYIDWNGTEPLL